jgi:hypothetical protein
MPKYELRKGGKVIERVEARDRGHEDTRLGLAAEGNKANARDGWVAVEEFTKLPAGTTAPDSDDKAA